MTSHTVGQGYSERSTVPTIQNFQAHQAALEAQQKAADAEQSSSQVSSSNSNSNGNGTGKAKDAQDVQRDGMSEKEEMKHRMKDGPEKPQEKLAKAKGQREVKDPVTGQQVFIKDAKFEDYPTAASVDPNNADVKGTSMQPVTSDGQAPAIPGQQDGEKNQSNKAAESVPNKFKDSRVAPNPAHASNINLQPFPDPHPLSTSDIHQYLNYAQFIILFASLFLLLTTFSHGTWKSLFIRSSLIGATGFGAITAVSLASRKLEKELTRIQVKQHVDRAETYSPPTPESVEWLNALVGTVWKVINPEMFVPIADMVEDILQQSLPKFVDAVRISDVGQGTNPFRIISMRALHDQPTDKEYPREEWIDQGTGQLMKQAKEAAAKGLEDGDQSGDYVNYEVAFSYQALPGQGNELRSKNIHLLIEFFLGVYDWFHIPIPIWIQVEGIVGTVRLRLQFVPEMPHIRNVTFTLMGVPAVEVSAIPMSRFLPNVLDLPLISTFVKMGIAAGTAEFVAPKSMTLNLMEMMSGAAIGDTRALGVFVITIKRAEGLSAQDRNGYSDPYIVLAYAKFGKPQYSTRVITEDLNPNFEESAYMLVTEDEVKAEEDISAMLWDSDKRSADDLIGRVQIPVKELIKPENHGKMLERTDKLVGFEDATEMSGTLIWSIGYFPKVPLNKQLERPDPAAPAKPPKSAVEMEMRPGDKAPNPGSKDLPPAPPVVSRTPPEKKYPSGILSVIVHHINNLERQNLKGAMGSGREGQAGQDTDDPAEEGANLPSSYCELVVNDDLIYKTRVKQYTSMPFFEAGTEVFIRDWQSTVVRIVVRDSVLREKDPILGIVELKLDHILTESSEITRLYSLQEGIGFGRVNVSLLFKAVDAKLPPNLLGWDTGTVEVIKPITVTINPDQVGNYSIKARKISLTTTDSTDRIPASAGEADTTNNTITWNISDDIIRLPVYNRFASSLVIDLGGDVAAIVWLRDYEEDKDIEVRVPVVTSKRLKNLKLNYLDEHTRKTHDVTDIGWLTTTIRIDSGLDLDHEKYAMTQARRHAFEAYDHIEGQAEVARINAHANDDGVIDKEEQKALDKAHARQLANRQRGMHGFRPFRTAIWAKEGLKRRSMSGKPKKKEPAVKSEAG